MSIGRPRYYSAVQRRRWSEIRCHGDWRLRPYSPPVQISIGKMEGLKALARIAGNAYVMDAAASLITYGIMLGGNLRCCPLS